MPKKRLIQSIHQIYFQDSNGETDIENRSKDMEGGRSERVICIEGVVWKFIISYGK